MSKSPRRRASSSKTREPSSIARNDGDAVQDSERITKERRIESPNDGGERTGSEAEPSKGEAAIKRGNRSDHRPTKSQPTDPMNISPARLTQSSMRPPVTTTRQLRRPINPSTSTHSATPLKGSTSVTPRATTITKPASRPESNPLKTKSIHKPRSASTASKNSDDTGHDHTGGRLKSIRQSINDKKDLHQTSRSVDQARGSATVEEPTREPAGSQVRTKPVARAETSLKTSKKAEFSTLQQHFTPKKGPKALTSSFLAPSPSKLPRPDAISAETARNQAELLQLHILHSTSFKVQTQWRHSAYAKMEDIFLETGNRRQRLLDQEHQTQRRVNYQALQDWADGSKYGHGLEERLQILGPLLQDVLSMTDSRGRYSKVVDEFEEWWTRSHSIKNARARASSALGSNGDLDFIEELSPHWKSETDSFSRKLSVQSQQLEDVGQAIEGSSLATILDNLRNYVRSMLEELALLRTFENDALVAERAFIEMLMNSLNIQDEDDDIEISNSHRARRGIWEG
jgi:hypothetical protein